MAPNKKLPLSKLKHLKDSRDYNTTDFLHKANKLFLSLEPDESHKMVTHLNIIAKALIDIMCKQDHLFDMMFKRFQYMGSFYEGMRVGTPSEFDLLMVMKIPINNEGIQVIDDSCTIKGSAKIQMPKNIKDIEFSQILLQKGLQRILNWCDQNYCLDQVQFRNWVKGVVDEALNTMILENGVHLITIQKKLYKISIKDSGPAITLQLEVEGVEMDIDLVPALIFSVPRWPGENFRLEPFQKVQGENWFAIPKPVKTNATELVKCRSWRIIFPEQDKRLMRDIFCLKNIVRLVKKLRDTQGLHIIKSYYIKVVFLLEMEVQSKRFWRRPMCYIFMHMLKRLHFYIKSSNLPNYWYKSQNLLDKLNKNALSQAATVLEQIIENIETNFEKDNFVMCRFILTEDEQTELLAVLFSDDKLTDALRQLKI